MSNNSSAEFGDWYSNIEYIRWLLQTKKALNTPWYFSSEEDYRDNNQKHEEVKSMSLDSIDEHTIQHLQSLWESVNNDKNIQNLNLSPQIPTRYGYINTVITNVRFYLEKINDELVKSLNQENPAILEDKAVEININKGLIQFFLQRILDDEKNPQNPQNIEDVQELIEIRKATSIE